MLTTNGFHGAFATTIEAGCVFQKSRDGAPPLTVITSLLEAEELSTISDTDTVATSAVYSFITS
jgi:hypothetical protein